MRRCLITIHGNRTRVTRGHQAPRYGDTVRPNGAPGKPLRILLVEDSPLLRGRLESMLSQYPAFKVTGLAAAEAEAVEKLDTVPYDAIVVDVELRPGSGISVIRAGPSAQSQTRMTARTCGSSC